MRYAICLLTCLGLLGCNVSKKPVSQPTKPNITEKVATPKPVAKATPKIAGPVTSIIPPVSTPTPQKVPIPATPVPFLEQPMPEPPAVTLPVPVKEEPILTEPTLVISEDDAPILTKEGLALIVDYEVGGEFQYKKWPHPEYSGGASGVTWGIGYDAHQNQKVIILSDWAKLGKTDVDRLAATQPYYGASAKAHVKDVVDITVPWDESISVFVVVDVSRTDTQCRKAFPGFDKLRAHAKDAIRSLVFNRGTSMIGPNRVEMRWMRDVGVPKQDYEGLANAEREMKHIWAGTDIQNGMYRRREAEAKLFLTP